ncbi:MAG: hypothetical protein U0003_05260 [Vampirovibrionales bacterium]
MPVSAPSTNPSWPRFGNAPTAGLAARRLIPSLCSTSVDGLHRYLGMPFFNKVMTDYLSGAMAVDIIALWMPRAYNALFRGALDYKPMDDPKARQKSGLDRYFYVMGQRFHRLNWPNFIEECGREFASGPGFFMWPTLVLSGIGLHFFNPYKRGIHLAHGDITRLGNAYQQFMGHESLEQLKKGSWKGEYQRFMDSLIDRETLLKGLSPEKTQHYNQQLTQILSDWEERLTDHRSDPRGQLAKIRDSWADWLSRRPDSSPEARLRKVQETFKNLIAEINQHRPLTHMMDKRAELPVLNHVFVSGGRSLTQTGHFVESMRRWFDVHHAFGKQVALFGEKLDVSWWKALWHNFRSTSYLPKGFSGTTLPDLVAHAENQLMKIKSGYMIATVAVTIGFLFKLVTWTQGHDNYVANRTLSMGGKHSNLKPLLPLANHPTPTAPLNHAFQQFASGAYPPSQASARGDNP